MGDGPVYFGSSGIAAMVVVVGAVTARARCVVALGGGLRLTGGCVDVVAEAVVVACVSVRLAAFFGVDAVGVVYASVRLAAFLGVDPPHEVSPIAAARLAINAKRAPRAP